MRAHQKMMHCSCLYPSFCTAVPGKHVILHGHLVEWPEAVQLQLMQVETVHHTVKMDHCPPAQWAGTNAEGALSDMPYATNSASSWQGCKGQNKGAASG